MSLLSISLVPRHPQRKDDTDIYLHFQSSYWMLSECLILKIPLFVLFLIFFHLRWKKMLKLWKRWIRPGHGVWSTHLLVKIHNNGHLNFLMYKSCKGNIIMSLHKAKMVLTNTKVVIYKLSNFIELFLAWGWIRQYDQSLRIRMENFIR